MASSSFPHWPHHRGTFVKTQEPTPQVCGTPVSPASHQGPLSVPGARPRHRTALHWGVSVGTASLWHFHSFLTSHDFGSLRVCVWPFVDSPLIWACLMLSLWLGGVSGDASQRRGAFSSRDIREGHRTPAGPHSMGTSPFPPFPRRLNPLFPSHLCSFTLYLWLNTKLHYSRSSRLAQWLTNPTRNHEVLGPIPVLAQWVKDLVLPQAVVYIADAARIPPCCGSGVGWWLQLQFDP